MIWKREFWESLDLEWLTPPKLALLATIVIAFAALVIGDWLIERRRRRRVYTPKALGNAIDDAVRPHGMRCDYDPVEGRFHLRRDEGGSQ